MDLEVLWAPQRRLAPHREAIIYKQSQNTAIGGSSRFSKLYFARPPSSFLKGQATPLPLILFFIFPMIAGCSEMAHQWREAERSNRESTQKEAQQILNTFIIQCEQMGYQRGSRASVDCVNLLTNNFTKSINYGHGTVNSPPTETPSVSPATPPASCSLQGRRPIGNNQVACRWSCGARTFETVEGANFGCQESPYR